MKANTVKRYGANAIEVDGVLVSYDTPVCAVRGGEFVRLWSGHSATTMRHVNMFRAEHCMPSITKAQWEKMEVES
jgi:hypothetical protein